MEEKAFDRLTKLSVSARATVLKQVLADPKTAWKIEPSYGQRRIWFLQRLTPDSPSLNIPEAFRLRGALDVRALDNAFSKVVARHKTLQSRFPYLEGKPLCVHSTQVFNLDVVHHGPLSEAEVSALVEADADQIFDLENHPPLRCRLHVLGIDDYLLTVTLHHIVADGLSLKVFYKDLVHCYTAFSAGRIPNLSHLEREYDDYIDEQRVLITGADLKSQVDFWRDYLRGAPELLDLPTDHPRPLRQSFRSGLLDVPIPNNTLGSLEHLARCERSTLFMVLLAGYATLLYKFSGQTDLLIGTPVAGRSPLDQEQIGLYTNTIIVRVDMSGNPSFIELVSRVRRATLAAYDYDKFPHDLLVEHLNPPRDTTSNPLFQVFFSLENQMAAIDQLGAALAERVEIDTRISARFDLSLAITTMQPDITKAKLGYAADLYDPATINALLRAYSRLLCEIVAAPTARVDSIPLIEPAEREALIARWTADRALDVIARPTLHSLFEREARLSPDAVAVAWRDEEVTYSKLDEQANRLANKLKSSGVQVGTVVAVCVERDPNLVITLLAVLKAGGVYLAVDPHLPTDRIDHLLTDSAAGTAVITAEYQRVLSRFTGTTVNLDELDLNEWQREAPATSVAGDDLAYIVYTSGSTGNPKGIAVEHRSVVNLVEARQKAYGASQFQSVLASSSVSFDSAVSELYVALTCGGTVVLVDSLFDLVDALPSKPFTMLETVPSLLRELLARGVLPASVRSICLGGEQVTSDLVDAVYATGTVERLYNTYGPTETTVSATRSLVPRGSDRPLIGTAIPGVRVYVLDSSGQPVPPGFRGELYIGGVGVARGYLNQPELTAHRFVQDHLAAIPRARMYRTGDMVRERSNGQLDWLGRDDRQIKIRGRRIEPGEVEHALRLIPGIEGAVVVIHDDQLCAYLVGGEQDPRELRTALSKLLPGALIPTVYVFVNSLPLNVAGKLDERALPAPPPREKIAPRPPVTDTEHVLMDVWADVLGHRNFGIDDNFFELGGHSLLVIRLVDRIHNALGLSIGIDTVFAESTIAGIAARLDVPGEHELMTLLPLRVQGERSPVICIHPAAGLGWAYLALLPFLPADQPMYALQDPLLVGASVEGDRMAHYAAAIGEISDNCILLGWSSGAVMAHALAQRIPASRLILVDGYLHNSFPQWKDQTTGNTLTRLLRSFGHEVDNVADYGGFREILTQARSPLASLTSNQVEALCKAYCGNEQWVSDYIPNVYSGSAVVIHSNLVTSNEAVAAWHPYLMGKVKVRSVELPHGRLFASKGAAIIAGEISATQLPISSGGV